MATTLPMKSSHSCAAVPLVQVVRIWTQWRTWRYARLNLNARMDLFTLLMFMFSQVAADQNLSTESTRSFT